MFGKRKSNDFGFKSENGPSGIAAKVKRNAFLSFIITFFKSLNPDAYPRLSSRKIKEGFSYFFSLMFFSLFIAFILIIPKVMSVQSELESGISKFSSFDIIVSGSNFSFNFLGISASLAPSFFPKPQDNSSQQVNQTNASAEKSEGITELDSDFVVSGSGIYRRPALCMLWNAICYIYPKDSRVERIGGNGFFNVLTYKKEYSSIIKTAIILMLPSLFLLLFIFHSAKYLFLIAVISVLMFFGSMALKHKISFKKVFNTAIYASTPMIILQMLSLPLGFLSGILVFLPFVLFALFLTIGLIITDSDIF